MGHILGVVKNLLFIHTTKNFFYLKVLTKSEILISILSYLSMIGLAYDNNFW